MNYNVTVSTRVPVTIWYNGANLPPVRQIAYRTPKVKQSFETMELGVIMFQKQRVPVKRTRESTCHEWSEWEARKLIDPRPGFFEHE